MGLHITPEIMENTYELLRISTPAFKKLPHADEVEFQVVHMRKRQDQADHCYNGIRHIIRISLDKHKTLASLTMTMAHEMCHMREYQRGFRRVDVMHGRLFNSIANAVCRHHGFDRGQF